MCATTSWIQIKYATRAIYAGLQAGFCLGGATAAAAAAAAAAATAADADAAAAPDRNKALA